MASIKLDKELFATMQLFSKITHANLKSCFKDEVTKQTVFVVLPGEMSKAIGKQGANVKRLEQMLKTKIKIVEYSDDKKVFLSRLLFPFKVKHIEEREDGVLLIEAQDHKTRGYIIGRAASYLRNLEVNMRRFFDIPEIKVV